MYSGPAEKHSSEKEKTKVYFVHTLQKQ